MNLNIHKFNAISGDLAIYQLGQGLVLFRPDEPLPRGNSDGYIKTGVNVRDFMANDFNMYILNQESTLMATGEGLVKNLGFDSIQNTLGKSVFDIPGISKQSANFTNQNDKQVMTSGKLGIFDEELADADNITCVNYLSVKFPWLNHDNDVIGIIGCSIAIGYHDLSRSLRRILDMGILMQAAASHLSNQTYDDLYLSRREAQILKLLIRGGR